MKKYEQMSDEELKQARFEALATRQEADKVFVAAGKILDARRRRARLVRKKAALEIRQAAIDEELSGIE